MSDKLRIDKWLWACRFYKTRSIASEQVQKGRILVNHQACKPSREVKVGDIVWVKNPDREQLVTVLGLSEQRLSAPLAQQLYQEDPESIAKHQQKQLTQKWQVEPAQTIKGRPSKKDRRALEKLLDE